MGRILVVNADDFGFTRDVNAGIIEAHTRGILTATTLMANGAAFDDAVRLAREHPTLDVGCHMVLVQGASLDRPGENLPSSLTQLIRALSTRRIDPYTELKAQAERILHSGLRPLHLDTHKHTHLLPPVLRAVARISREFGIPWVRRPFDIPVAHANPPLLVRAINFAIGGLRGRFVPTLQQYGCRTTDHFAGFQLTGRFRTAELVQLIRNLPEGTTEFMTHPGHCTDELRSMPTRLKESRQVELDALTAPEVRQQLDRSRVSLCNYRDLSD
ncbi:MAG TPA: ChbG/HpnK family deacetylase [Bryobacteraceae bacterium]|nr:ChbG/HpnK family deacetylase [Bryobacteraceae bacterium]